VLAELVRNPSYHFSRATPFHNLLPILAKEDVEALQASVPNLPGTLRLAAEKAVYGQLLREDMSSALPRLFEAQNGMEIFFGDSKLFRERPDEILAVLPQLPYQWKVRLAGSPNLLLGTRSIEEVVVTDWEGLGLDAWQAGRIEGWGVFLATQKNPPTAAKLFSDLNPVGQQRLVELMRMLRGNRDIDAALEDLLPILEESYP
jgi:hypothetical protein